MTEKFADNPTEQINQLTFKEWITLCLRERHLNQRGLAEAMDISSPYLSHLINGKRQFSLHLVQRLSEALALRKSEEEDLLRFHAGMMGVSKSRVLGRRDWLVYLETLDEDELKREGCNSLVEVLLLMLIDAMDTLGQIQEVIGRKYGVVRKQELRVESLLESWKGKGLL